MRVLYFASEYLPYNNTGTFRTVKFVKALHHKGIEVAVITLEPGAAKEFIGDLKIDPSLEQMEEIPVERIIPASLFRYLFNLKSFIRPLKENSFPLFFNRMNEVVKAFKPDIFIATHPHSATIRLADYLSNKAGIPLVLDMRDTWSYWPMAAYRTRFHHYLTRKAEKKIFERAAAIITVTSEVGNIFVDSHGSFLSEKIKIIPNSFEGDILIPGEIVAKSFQPGQVIRIGYIGSFYYDPKIRSQRFTKWYKRKGLDKLTYFSGNEDWLYRSPFFFLTILNELFSKHPEYRAGIRVEFIGRNQAWLEEMINSMGLQDICIQVGFLNKDQLKIKYMELDYLLATSEKVINGRSYCLPSKLFDYLTLGKPILGCVTEGIQKDFLKNSGISLMLDPDNVEGSVKTLINLFGHGFKGKINQEFLEKFQLKNTSESLISTLKKI